MAAYLIVSATIHDRDAFINGYAQAAAKLTAEYGGTYVVRAPGIEVLEGTGREGGSVVISSWPDKNAILNFWNSAAYQEAKLLRKDCADVDVIVVEEPA